MTKIWFVILFGLPSVVFAQEQSNGGYATRDDVKKYIKQLHVTHGFEVDALRNLFAKANKREDIIEKISRPAEKVWTWGKYKNLLVDEQRILLGVEFWRSHQQTLAKAAEKFGVDESYIVAILGIETRYGQVMGSYPVFEALLTLGFDYPPRSTFFRKELTEFLLLAREEGKSPDSLMGSYAGAMGYGQFISSSYRHYAVDFDDDGVRDIWQNPVDAIGSIANYFAKHRWQGDDPVALPVSVVDEKLEEFLQLASTDPKPKYLLSELIQKGLSLPPSHPANVFQEHTKVALFALQTDEKIDLWIGFPDFYVITRYNHSHLYAMAVHHIAQGLSAEFNR